MTNREVGHVLKQGPPSPESKLCQCTTEDQDHHSNQIPKSLTLHKGILKVLVCDSHALRDEKSTGVHVGKGDGSVAEEIGCPGGGLLLVHPACSDDTLTPQITQWLYSF